MNKIQQMIEMLCPEGVEWKRLGEVLDYEQPSKYIVDSTDYVEKGVPVLTAGQSFILGYTDETDGIFKASRDNPVIIFDDFTTSFHWVDFDFKVKSSAMKMLRPKIDDADFRFVYYAMQCIVYETLEHSRQWISKYSKIEIPLPPLPIQEEIVGILDKFSELEVELEAELDCRKKQYEHYRDKLLAFEGREDVEWKKLGECVNLRRGVRVVKEQLNESDAYPVFQNSLAPMGFYSQYNVKAGSTYFICAGGCSVGYCDSNFWAADDCYYVQTDEDIVNKYIYHAVKSKQYKLLSQVRKASVPRLSSKAIFNLIIPIPPIEEQHRLVSILDHFESLTTSISEGLPAEIKARRQQYEYYRNQLLTFKKKEP